MTDTPTLPASCADCVYRPSHPLPGVSCRRHAPSPGEEEFEPVHWPKVLPDDRCGSGAAVGDGTGPGVVSCQACMHWYQPRGLAVKPDYRKGRSVEWWAESGYCTRLAPSPSAEEERKIFWRVTHASESCGDGDAAQSVASSRAS